MRRLNALNDIHIQIVVVVVLGDPLLILFHFVDSISLLLSYIAHNFVDSLCQPSVNPLALFFDGFQVVRRLVHELVNLGYPGFLFSDSASCVQSIGAHFLFQRFLVLFQPSQHRAQFLVFFNRLVHLCSQVLNLGHFFAERMHFLCEKVKLFGYLKGCHL